MKLWCQQAVVCSTPPYVFICHDFSTILFSNGIFLFVFRVRFGQPHFSLLPFSYFFFLLVNFFFFFLHSSLIYFILDLELDLSAQEGFHGLDSV